MKKIIKFIYIKILTLLAFLLNPISASAFQIEVSIAPPEVYNTPIEPSRPYILYIISTLGGLILAIIGYLWYKKYKSKKKQYLKEKSSKKS